MGKKLKMKQIKRIFKMLAQGRPEPERIYIKGLMRSVIGRASGLRL
jgi:hypothetical protein